MQSILSFYTSSNPSINSASTSLRSKIIFPFSVLFFYCKNISLDSTSASTIPTSNVRLKQELNTIVTTPKKRAATDSDDDDVIPLGSSTSSSSIIRQPVKKLPNSKPDFHSFAPENREFLSFYSYSSKISFHLFQ